MDSNDLTCLVCQTRWQLNYVMSLPRTQQGPPQNTSAENHNPKSTDSFKYMSKMQSSGGALELALHSLGSQVVGSPPRAAGCSSLYNCSINRWCMCQSFLDGSSSTPSASVPATPPIYLKVTRVWLHKMQKGSALGPGSKEAESGRMLFVFAFMPCSSNESLWLSRVRDTLQHVVSAHYRTSYNEPLKGYNHRIANGPGWCFPWQIFL